MTLKEIIQQAMERGVGVGHFNISDLAGLRGIFEAAQGLNAPVIIGVSEGERDFIGVSRASALIRNIREEFNYPIFLNADHSHSLEKVEEAAKAGFDAILFDGGQLSFKENIKMTKQAVEIAKGINPEILVEGELGYIGDSSKILRELPKGITLEGKDLTKPEEIKEFIAETGIDLLAPAVGNIHGILANIPNPRLDIIRIKEIKKETSVPLVLHGGSGLLDDDFRMAIKAGMAIIHINTEIRIAWRKGVELGLKKNRDEVAPYKILPLAVDAVREVVSNRLRLFNGLV